MTKKKKQKEKYIRLRKGKKSNSYQIDIPYSHGSETLHFVQTLNTANFEYDDNATLLAARMIRDKKLQEISTGKFIQKMPTVKWFYEKSWEFIPRSVKTRERHDSKFRQGIEPYADMPLNKITVADVQKCINDYAESHSQGETDRVLSIWRDIYKCAKILEYNIQDPTEAVIKPKSKIVITHKSQSVTDADIETMLVYILEYNPDAPDRWQNLATYYILNVMYYTGCRPAEVLPLLRSDIHDGYISITKSLGSTSRNKNVVVPTKTDGSTRKVPVSSELKPVIEEILKWSEHDEIFAKPDGSHYSITEFSSFIRRVSSRRGINFHSYMLRHKLSTDLVRNQNTRLAKDIMGHSNAGMTLSYARTTAEEMRQAVEGRTFAEKMPKKKISRHHHTSYQRWYFAQRFILDIKFILYTMRDSDIQ